MKKLSKIIKVSTSVLLGCGLIETLPLTTTSCGKSSVSISYDGEYNFQGEVSTVGHSQGVVKMTDGATLKVESIEESGSSIDLSNNIYLDDLGHICWQGLGGRDTPYEFKLSAVKGQASSSLGRKFSIKIEFPTSLKVDTTINDIHAIKNVAIETTSLTGKIKDNLGYPFSGAVNFSLVDSKLHDVTLPTGLTLDATTGKISGTPQTSLIAENYRIRVNSSTAGQNFTGYSNSFDLSIADNTTSLSFKNSTKNIKSISIYASQSYKSPTEWLEWTNNIIETGDTETKTIDPKNLKFDWSSNASIPMGLKLDPNSGEISGAPVEQDAGKTFDIQIAFAYNGKIGFSNTFEIKIDTTKKQLYFSNSYSSLVGSWISGQDSTFTSDAPTILDQFNNPVDSTLLNFSINSRGQDLPAGVTFDTTTGKISGKTQAEACLTGLSLSVTYKAPDPAWEVTDGKSNEFAICNLSTDASKYELAAHNKETVVLPAGEEFHTQDLSNINYKDSTGTAHILYNELDNVLDFHWNHEGEFEYIGVLFNHQKGMVYGVCHMKQGINQNKFWLTIKPTTGQPSFDIGSEGSPLDTIQSLMFGF